MRGGHITSSDRYFYGARGHTKTHAHRKRRSQKKENRPKVSAGGGGGGTGRLARVFSGATKKIHNQMAMWLGEFCKKEKQGSWWCEKRGTAEKRNQKASCKRAGEVPEGKKRRGKKPVLSVKSRGLRYVEEMGAGRSLRNDIGPKQN